jgi:DHA1 family tetracycline resistance protein-like MFS transporter
VLLVAVVLLDMVAFGIVIPILPFITPRLGGGSFDIALIIVTYSVFAGLAGPLWGRLSDRIGRKPVLMLCTAGGASAYLLLAGADSLWMVYAARACAGLAAGNFPVASAMMADITAASERARGMGLIGAAFGIGLVLGPVLGGLLSGPEGSFAMPCLLAALLAALAVPAIWWFLPEPHREGSRTRSQPRRPLWDMIRASHSRLLLLQYALHTGSVSAITYLFPLWVFALLGWEAREVGIVFGVVGVIMAVNQGLLMGRLIRRLGERHLLRICISVLLAGLLAAQFAAGPLFVVATLLLSMGGATLCMPVLNAMTSRRAVAEERGRLLGAASSAAAVGRIAGPLLAGGLLSVAGFAAAWLLPLLLVLAYWSWAFLHLGSARDAVHGAD